MSPHGAPNYSLKITPISVNTTSCDRTKNAKYLPTTARSKRDWVSAPWYCDSQRTMMGMKKLKKPDTAGGRTPETTANEVGEALAQDWIKGTNTWSWQGYI